MGKTRDPIGSHIALASVIAAFAALSLALCILLGQPSILHVESIRRWRTNMEMRDLNPGDIVTPSLADLQPWSGNPRRISPEHLTALQRSMGEFGDLSGITWNRRTRRLGCGHQRLLALIQKYGDALRMEGGAIITPDGQRFPVRVVDWSEAVERAANVAANSPLLTGEWTEALGPILDQIEHDLPELAAALHLDELRDFVPEIELPDLEEEEEIPEPPAVAFTQLGDIWHAGDHRILNDDSTLAKNLERLLGGAKARMAFLDPPWNVGIGLDSNPRHRQREGLINDNLSDEEFALFLKATADILAEYCVGDVYVVMGCEQWPVIDRALREAGFHWSATCIWKKDLFTLGRGCYQRQFEAIWFGWPKGKTSTFQGARDESDVWEIPRPRRSEHHASTKPTALPARALKNSSTPGTLVLDTYLGVGATLLACEQMHRRCYGAELSSRYVDVIIKRWMDATGKKPRLERGGRILEWAEIEAMGFLDAAGGKAGYAERSPE